MRLFDTAARQVVSFEPGPRVTMYVCGLTPYDATHVGHAATYVTFDVVKRRLLDLGHDVRCVRNITDVDDDLLERSRLVGVHYLDLATEQLRVFHDDLDALDVLPVCAEPRATGVIADIRGFIHQVLDAGHAYLAGGAVYFDVASFAGFGTLSGFDRDAMRDLAAVRGGHPDDPAKRDPLDFVLWKSSGPGEPAWDSPWGPGRPGWHIQCSALALRELGTTVDLHGGGRDLVYPHHECERAQSEAVTGQPFVRHWMHQGLVRHEGEKMAKSLGNLVFVGTLRQSWEAATIRLALLANHYRHDWDWHGGLLEAADLRLGRWRVGTRGVGGDAAIDDVRAALDDDLDTPAALAAIDAAVSAGHDVTRAAALLGVALS